MIIYKMVIKKFTKKYFLISIGILVFILSSGCAAKSRSGFSLIDGSPLPETIESSNNMRKIYLKNVQDIADNVLKNPPIGKVITEAKEVLYKLKELESVTEMGVSYVDYPKYLREAKFAIDRFSDEFNKEYKIIYLLKMCIEPFIKAQEPFSRYINFREGTMGRAEYGFYTREHWKTGSQTINIVSALMRDLNKI